MSEFERVAKADRELDRFNEWAAKDAEHVVAEVGPLNGPHYVPSEWRELIRARLQQSVRDAIGAVRIGLENDLREAAADAKDRIDALSSRDKR